MLSKLRPSARHDSITHIDLKALQRKGIRALLLDLDNTLVAYRSHRAKSGIRSWVRHAKRLGIKPVILSNNNRDRVQKIANKLEVPFVCGARKPLRSGYQRALAAVGADPAQTAAVGDQLFTDVLGGNRAGLLTILVRPMDRKEFIGTRFVRPLERFLLWGLDRKARRTAPFRGRERLDSAL